MKDSGEVRKGEMLNWQKLEPYLREHLPDTEGKMTYAQFYGGHANLTYLIKFERTEYVLRRPPFGKIAPGAHDMKREYRVLSKLYEYFPQAPRAFHLCENEAIIGSRFVVMERRQGVVMRFKLLECFKKFKTPEKRLTEALVRAQANLHTVDVHAADLTNLGRPEGFIERQLQGWIKRWNFSKTEENKDMEFVFEVLSANVPEPQTVSIIHNDWKFDNCQFQPDNPDLVTSVFDWDMATLGDPLIDFGSALGYWPDKRFEHLKLPIQLKGNFPNKDFLKEKYIEYTGFDLKEIGWYEAFSYWKSAVILQQLYQRYVKGDSTDKRMATLGTVAKGLAAISGEIVKEGI